MLGLVSAATSNAARARSNESSGRLTSRSKSARMRSVEPMSRPLLAWQPPVLRWYRRHRRALPWRETRDPMRSGSRRSCSSRRRSPPPCPIIAHFLARFPTLASLAAAREPQVLAAWSGLGYYRRARHLHAAARQVVCDHHGRIPDNPQTFARLPGVGRYTTGAVLSISFDRPLPALDGNVARSVVTGLRNASDSPRSAWRPPALVAGRHPGSDAPPRGLEPGFDGARGDGLPAPNAPLRGLSHREMVRGARPGQDRGLSARAGTPCHRAGAACGGVDRATPAHAHDPRRGPLLEGLWEPPGVELPGTSPARPRLARAPCAGRPRAPRADRPHGPSRDHAPPRRGGGVARDADRSGSAALALRGSAAAVRAAHRARGATRAGDRPRGLAPGAEVNWPRGPLRRVEPRSIARSCGSGWRRTTASASPSRTAA